MTGSRLVVLLAVISGLLVLPGAATAQETVEELAAECGEGSGEALREWCREVAVAFRAAQGAVGLAGSGGAAVTGMASTLGKRLGSTPRLTFAARLTGTRPEIPEIGTHVVPAPGGRGLVPAAQLTAGAGVFDGFSPAPTVGGLFALDLLGTAGASILPSDRGFDGSTATLGVGARLGLLRESFTLPGVSVSAAHRWSGDVVLGGGGGRTAGEVGFDLSTTSLRAVVGKDLMAVGVVLGGGWDRYESDVHLRASVAEATQEGSASADDFVSSRPLLFGGAAMNFLVLQVSAEAGWAAGSDRPPERAAGGYDPGTGTWFGSVALRLTY